MTIRDDIDLAKPRCPSCQSIDDMERLRRGPKRWWCGACNLACDGSPAEHRAAALARAEADRLGSERDRRAANQ